jgi:Tfp pilus assembly protein PilF
MVVEGWLFAFLLVQSLGAKDYHRAAQLFARQDLQGAEAAVEQSLRGDPQYIPALTLKARLAMIGGRMEDARRTLDIALAVDPKQPGAKFLLGFSFYLENNFQAALDEFAHSDPNDARVSLYKALSAEGLNHVDSAIEFYERSLKLDPVNGDARVAYSRLMRKLGKLDRAESLINAAPDSRSVFYEKAQCRFERGSYEQAAELGERALATPGPAPSEREVRFLLARAYLKAGKPDLAGKHRAIFENLPMPLVR